MKYIGMIELSYHNDDDTFIGYIQHDIKNNKLIAGTSSNCGFIPQFEIDFDDCFSLDENLQYFIEIIQEQLESETD